MRRFQPPIRRQLRTKVERPPRKRSTRIKAPPVYVQYSADEWSLARAYYDLRLQPVARHTDSDRWLAIELIGPAILVGDHLCGDATRAFVEIRTRFLLATEGRYRRQCLAVAKRIADVQQGWSKQCGARFPFYGNRSPRDGVPPFAPTLFESLVVVDQARFDDQLRPIESPDAACALAVALVHPLGLPFHYECRIRTNWCLFRAGKGSRRALKVADQIAAVQEAWTARFVTPFHVVGRIHPYVYVPKFSTLLRAYGKRSEVLRAPAVTALYLACAEIAAAWDEYVDDPAGMTVRVFGARNLVCAVATVAALTRGALDRVTHLEEVGDLPSAVAKVLRQRIEAGQFHRLSDHFQRKLRQHLKLQQARPEGELPAPATVVHRKLCDRIDAGEPTSLSRRREGNRAATPINRMRTPLTLALVREVGEELGYARRRRRRLRHRGGRDKRVYALVARKLAKRFKSQPSTVLRMLIRPALDVRDPKRPTFAGPLFLLDHAPIGR